MPDSVTYEYDLNGRLKKLTFANSDTFEVTYDDMGNRVEAEMVIAPPLRSADVMTPPDSSSPVNSTPAK